MIEYLKEEMELQKLYAEIRKSNKLFNQKIQKLRSKNLTENELKKKAHELLNIRDGETEFERLEIEFIKTMRLLREAHRFCIPIPDQSDGRIWKDILTRYYLTDIGKFELNRAIRQEKKERREAFLQYCMAITGLLGVLIGIISAIKK